MAQYKVLNKNRKEIHRPEALHPGEVVALELQARGIKKVDFALALSIKPSHLSKLVSGKRHVSAATALRLESLLGIAAEYWLRIQIYYDLHQERLKVAA